jgi:hypothetical protein
METNEYGADGRACVSIISCDAVGVPQEEQNRLASEISEEQEGQLIMNSSAGSTVASDDSSKACVYALRGGEVKSCNVVKKHAFRTCVLMREGSMKNDEANPKLIQAADHYLLSSISTI